METITSQQAREALWRKGLLTWKLRDVQKQMYREIRGYSGLKFVVNSARRLGKSYLMCLMAIEDALCIPECQVRFAAPTQKALRKILHPIIREICRDCPDDLRPIYRTYDQAYYFPSSKGEIHISGANNGHDENLRGTSAHRCYIDEAGFIKDLRYLVEDILMPQLLTTGGSLVVSSTPPKTPAHAFVEYAHEAFIHGNYAKFDIYHAGYPEALIQKFCQEAGGEHSTTWKREYLCQFVVDANSAVVPEFEDWMVQEPKIDEYFQFYHKYVGMDVGVSDYTAVLFGYYDYKQAKLYIQDEYLIRGPQMTTDILAIHVRNKEHELWKDKDPFLRIADNNNLLLLQDMGSMHGLHFAPTGKDMIETMVNNLRIFVKNQRLIVSPKCANLIGCLKNAIWDDNRRTFAKSAVYGHFDALAALIYLVRNLDVQTNPIPPMYNLDQSTHFISDDLQRPKQEKEMRAMLGLGRKYGN